jgi:hypothetical protein
VTGIGKDNKDNFARFVDILPVKASNSHATTLVILRSIIHIGIAFAPALMSQAM